MTEGRGQQMFTGVSAFPLTPLKDDRVDEQAFANIIKMLNTSGVDSITALGSTGSYVYLTRQERARVARVAVENAAGTPVFIGVGALRTSHVLQHIADAEEAGAQGVLLAPVSYQPLTEEDVFELFKTVTGNTKLPVIVYDNPGTTHFTFTNELYAKVARLPGIASIKIPPAPTNAPRPLNVQEMRARVTAIKETVPDHVTIGISGDAAASTALEAGADTWYSVIAGTLPEPAVKMVHATKNEDFVALQNESNKLEAIWGLFTEFGSLRVTASIAQARKLVTAPPLPLPIQPLKPSDHERVIDALAELAELEETA